MKTEAQKKLVMPLITAIMLFSSSLFVLGRGIEEHQTWRIVVACFTMAMTLAIIIISAVQYRKLKRVPDEK